MPGFIAFRTLPLIYLNMPKAGCTSVKNFIYYLDNGQYLEEPLEIHNNEHELLHYDRCRAEVEGRFKTDFVFTFVRHPLKRCYSLFNEKIFNQWKYSFPEVRRRMIEYYDLTFSDDPSVEEHRHNFMGFLKFIRGIQAGNIEFRFDYHYAPQMRILNEAERTRHVNFIGKTEKFADDFHFVLRRSGFKGDYETPRFNEGGFIKYSYDEILSDEVIRLGREIYHRDCVHLGYLI